MNGNQDESGHLIDEATKTPRTDDQAIRIMFGMLDTVVPVEFSRELETELADAKAEIERLKSEHEDSLRRTKNYMVSLSGTVTEQAGELLAKDKQFAEAQAEIERLNKGIKIVQSAFKDYKNADAIIARATLKKAQILSASCNPDAVDSERAANEILTTEIERKSKLIEQMREALKLALPEAQSTHCENIIKAALAAERGG